VRAAWPVELRGVTESVVATRGPNDRWNLAALGLRVRDDDGADSVASPGPVTARTWGQTRTRRNFTERGRGHVQFTRDPVDFVEAALGIVERDEPVVASVDASVEVTVDRRREGETAGTTWVDWRLDPVDATVQQRVVPVTNRGYNAVVEGTVAASRLGVATYESETLLDRLAYFETVVERCGGPAEGAAWDRLRELVDEDW